MYTFIIVLLIIASIMLALLVLVQNSKGGGLTSGLSASNQVMGVRKTTDFLEKLTWGFAITLLVLAMAGNLVLPKSSTGGSESLIEDQIQNTAAPATPQIPAPGSATQQPAASPADTNQ